VPSIAKLVANFTVSVVDVVTLVGLSDSSISILKTAA